MVTRTFAKSWKRKKGNSKQFDGNSDGYERIPKMKIVSFAIVFFIAGLGVIMIFKMEEPNRQPVGIECNQGGIVDCMEKSITASKEKDNLGKAKRLLKRASFLNDSGKGSW